MKERRNERRKEGTNEQSQETSEPMIKQRKEERRKARLILPSMDNFITPVSIEGYPSNFWNNMKQPTTTEKTEYQPSRKMQKHPR